MGQLLSHFCKENKGLFYISITIKMLISTLIGLGNDSNLILLDIIKEKLNDLFTLIYKDDIGTQTCGLHGIVTFMNYVILLISICIMQPQGASMGWAVSTIY
jgi:hypothetical protein